MYNEKDFISKKSKFKALIAEGEVLSVVNVLKEWVSKNSLYWDALLIIEENYKELMRDVMIRGILDRSDTKFITQKNKIINRILELINEISIHDTADFQAGKKEFKKEIDKAYEFLNNDNPKEAFQIFYRHRNSPFFTGKDKSKLSDLYERGLGTNFNIDEASKWSKSAVESLKKEAEQGEIESKGLLGASYLLGKGVDKDIGKGLKLLRESAQNGFTKAQVTLGAFLTQGDPEYVNTEEGIKWLNIAAEKGDVKSQFILGLIHLHGGDLKKCHKWLAKASDQGHPEALFFLGKMHEQGIGVDINYQEAEYLFKRAYENGYSDAHYDYMAMRIKNNKDIIR